MTALQAYLQNSKTRKVLSKKPGEAGFSLIELVVVVAVLAILSAIAIPAFQSISEKARAAAASNTMATIVKECAVKLNDGGGNYNSPSLDGYRGSKVGTTGNTQTTTTFGWHTTTAAVAAVGTTPPTAATATAVTTSPAPCLDTGGYSLISSDETRYPTFNYDVTDGSKTCIASGKALDRGCPVSGKSW